jgi:hypothetical protein
MEEVIISNSEAIKRIDREIVKVTNNVHVYRVSKDTTDNVSGDEDVFVKRKTKKCRYYNRRYCKYKASVDLFTQKTFATIT